MKNKILSFLAVGAMIVFLVSPITTSAKGFGLGIKFESSSHANVSTQDKNDNDNEQNENDHLSASTSASSSVQDDDSLPPGIRHAPGIEKRIENGKGLPSGLLKFFGNFFGGFHFSHHEGTTSTTTATTTVKVAAPAIYFSTVYGVTGNSANFFWFTNQSTDSQVWISTSSPVNISGSANASSTGLVRFHNLHVSGLATSTVYFYTVESINASGKMATTSGSFTTHAE